MNRVYGTVSMGLRAPIIRQGDDLAKIVTDSVVEAMHVEGLTPRDRDVVCMTEAIVARATPATPIFIIATNTILSITFMPPAKSKTKNGFVLFPLLRSMDEQKL